MTGHQIRSLFLDFFKDNGHAVVESSSLVPQDDPTLLFTNAGMVQFKRVFMGEERRSYVRAATSQRCVRAGGKHNDLENVGHTARHHTFFEMLGNFSFGDYFKEEAIRLAWEFLTVILELPADKLWISVYRDDDEAHGLWEKIDGLPAERIVRLDEKDNFWAMGDTGPCGPCSEIHIDQGPEVGCGRPDCDVACDCDRFLELWNLVFMQYYRDEEGRLTQLPEPSIDTGMGLERIAAVVQGKHNNFDSDLIAPLIDRISALCGRLYGRSEADDVAMRVIADHGRAVAFLVADGMLPANEGRGYVLRRIMRRAIRFGQSLGLEQAFLADITDGVVELMAAPYPHLLESRELLDKVVSNEESRFRETLDNGLTMLHTGIEDLQRREGKERPEIPGDFIFRLYDTYGFPVDIVKDVAQEKGLTVDEAGFAEAMEEQRRRSRKSWKEGGLGTLAEGVRALAAEGHQARFVGYETSRADSCVTGMMDAGGNSITTAGEGDTVSLFCPETPFYAEAGGQVGDRGRISGPRGKGKVTDTVTVGDGLILHEVAVESGTLSLGDKVELQVSEGRRQRTANHHTATHLLHAAMKQVLGEHVKQSGSLVTPERLRFDFTHFSPMSDEELTQVENMVNEQIRANLPVTTMYRKREQAVREGAVALFGEKYGERVRVVSVGDVSMELCGGIHVKATGEIGLCKIVSESGVAAGTRRLEAVTGPMAFKRFQQDETDLDTMADLLKSPREDLITRLQKTLQRVKELEKEVGRLTARLTIADLDSLVRKGREVDGVKIVAAHIPLDSPKTLREIGDRVRDRLTSGVVVLGGVYQEKAALLCMVTGDLTSRVPAGRLIKPIAALVGGSGGGRPDMAQAGGPDAGKLPEAMKRVPDLVAEQLGHT